MTTIMVKRSKVGKKKQNRRKFYTPDGKVTSTNFFLKSWEKDNAMSKNLEKGINSNKLFWKMQQE